MDKIKIVDSHEHGEEVLNLCQCTGLISQWHWLKCSF